MSYSISISDHRNFATDAEKLLWEDHIIFEARRFITELKRSSGNIYATFSGATGQVDLTKPKDTTPYGSNVDTTPDPVEEKDEDKK